MADFHGIKTNILTSGSRAITAPASAVIGLIATATALAGAETDALNAAFPLNRPVLLTSVGRAIGQAGTSGTLKPALEAIAAQASPLVVVVRVGTDVDPVDQDALAVGGSVGGQYTGAQALLMAESLTGVRPRILGAPGLDTPAVTTAMAVLGAKLGAMAYCSLPGDDLAAATANSTAYGQKELVLIWPGTTSPFAGHAAACALGLRAQIDEQTGWHKTLSNVPVNGITGIAKDVSFDVRGGNDDADLLNTAGIVTLARTDGFRFWGNNTASGDAFWKFESAVRTSQILEDGIAQGLLWAIDLPITGGLIKDIVETVNAYFRRLIARGQIIGGKCWFDDASNPPEQLAAGKVVIDYDFTPAAPLEGLELNQRITHRYYADLLAQQV